MWGWRPARYGGAGVGVGSPLNPAALPCFLSPQHLSPVQPPPPHPSGLAKLKRISGRVSLAGGDRLQLLSGAAALQRLGKGREALAAGPAGEVRFRAAQRGPSRGHRTSCPCSSNSPPLRPKGFLEDSLLFPGGRGRADGPLSRQDLSLQTQRRVEGPAAWGLDRWLPDAGHSALQTLAGCPLRPSPGEADPDYSGSVSQAGREEPLFSLLRSRGVGVRVRRSPGSVLPSPALASLVSSRAPLKVAGKEVVPVAATTWPLGWGTRAGWGRTRAHGHPAVQTRRV